MLDKRAEACVKQPEVVARMDCTGQEEAKVLKSYWQPSLRVNAEAH